MTYRPKYTYKVCTKYVQSRISVCHEMMGEGGMLYELQNKNVISLGLTVWVGGRVFQALGAAMPNLVSIAVKIGPGIRFDV